MGMNGTVSQKNQLKIIGLHITRFLGFVIWK